MSERETPLPQGWAHVSIDDLCQFNPKHDRDTPSELPVSFVPMAAVSEVSGRIETPEIRTFGEVKKGFTHFADGDVIWAKITPCMENGKSALANELTNGLGCGSTEFMVLRSHGAVENTYLHRFMRQESYRVSARKTMKSGVGQARVPKEFVLGTEIPLPPLNEQKRIVAKVEALQARSNAAREALDAIPPLLEKFRQSVLAAAFRGDLTKAWRQANPDVEPASELLARIRAERRRRWEEAKPGKKYKEPEPVNTEGLPELPEGWCWASLDELASGFDYGTAAKSDNEGEMPVLRMGNLQRGEIDWRDLKYTSDRNEIEKYHMVPNTVLFNRTNSPELVGKTAIYRGERPAVFAGYLIRIVLLEAIEPDYVNLNLNSPWGRDWCWNAKSDGVSQSNISAGKLQNYPIPLCSSAEQRAIVKLVRERLALADVVVDLCAQSQARQESLNQSILAKAFRGELVPQDPNDEPAGVLLERIREERAAVAGGSASKRGRKPKKGPKA